MPLHAARERRAHLADVDGIFAVGFLRASPARMAQQVHADAAEQVGALDARLDADRLADALLERGIERRAARHRHREAGGGADHDAARPVAEAEAGKAEPWRRPRRETGWR